MKTIIHLKSLPFFIAALVVGAFSVTAAEKPDVLFIAIDDMNDWPGAGLPGSGYHRNFTAGRDKPGAAKRKGTSKGRNREQRAE